VKRQLLEEILKGINERGRYEVSLEALETVLGLGDRRGPHSKEQIFRWADENKLEHDYIEDEQTTIVRFSRK